jgi:hypothetical protein
MNLESLKSDVYVYIESYPVTGIVALNTQKVAKEKEVRGILSDKPQKIITYNKAYKISIELLGKDLPNLSENFTMRIERGLNNYIYKKCFIKSLNRSFTDGKLKTKAEIISFEKE